MAESSGYLNPEVLAGISRLDLRAKLIVEGTIAGLHRSPLHGLSVEFAGNREYAPGDDLKRLDWRVYARSDRYTIREYEEESNLRATILFDASASMAYAGRNPGAHWGGMSKFDYAATLAASLASLLLRQRDAVGLVTFDRRHRTLLRPAATQSQLARIIEVLEDTKPDRTTELGDVILRMSDQIKRRGIIIVISDLLTDLDRFYQGLGKLQHQGQEVMIFHLLDRDELDLPFDGSVIFRDLEGTDEIFAEPKFFKQAYQRAISAFCTDVAQRCQSAGMDYLLLATDGDLGRALRHYLRKRQSMRGRSATTRIFGVR